MFHPFAPAHLWFRQKMQDKLESVELGSTRVVTRSGNPRSSKHLMRASLLKAKSIVILSPAEGQDVEADAQVIAQCLAV